MNPTVAELAAVIAADQSSGISARGVITLALIVSAVIAVRRANNKADKPPEKGDAEKPPDTPRKGLRARLRRASAPLTADPGSRVPGSAGPPSWPPADACDIPEDLIPYVSHAAILAPPAPRPTPETPPPALNEMFGEVPPELSDKLIPAVWDEMCKKRGLAGLLLEFSRLTPFGTDVHVRFTESLKFKTVLEKLDDIEAGLDMPNDWRLQLKPSESRATGILRIVTCDPLAEPIMWESDAAPVRLRNPMWISRTPFGDDVHLSVKQRIGVFGTSGAGKSCVQRQIGAHVIQAVDANLEIWDLKFGIESQAYEGKAHRVTTPEEAAERVAWMLNVEFPRRARIMKEQRVVEWDETPENPALVIMVDEGNSLARNFSTDQMKSLGAMVEQGRALGVYFVWATQYPKATNLPTEIRSQLDCRVCLRMITSEDARVVFKDDVNIGWAPHRLIGPGWMMIKDVDHVAPDESKSRWLSKDAFVTVSLSGTAPRSEGQAVPELSPSCPAVSPSVPDKGTGSVSEAIWGVLALSELSGDGPLGVSELSRRTGRPKSSVSETLSRMERDRTVCRTGTDARPLFCLPQSDN